MRSLVLSIVLYARATWTFTAHIERRMQAMEMRCFKLLGISYRNRITNKEVKPTFENAIGPYDDLRTSVNRRKLKLRARHTITWTGQDCSTGNSTRRETKRQTQKTMGRQHKRVDWPKMEHHTAESREPRGVEEVGCKISSGAPTVS